MNAHEFTVSALDLDAAGKLFHFPVRPEWVRRAAEGTEIEPAGNAGELEVRLSKSGTDVVLRGTLAAEFLVPCARCLEPARVVVREPLSALFVAGQGAPRNGADHPKRGRGERGDRDEEGEEAHADEADVMSYDGETVVLDDLVRDEILLAVPMIPLCSESCAGIRPPG
jgi:uncharacterized protein